MKWIFPKVWNDDNSSKLSGWKFCPERKQGKWWNLNLLIWYVSWDCYFLRGQANMVAECSE